MLRYCWVEEYGVDGFRFDLVKGMGDNGSYGIAWNRATNSFATPTEASTNRFNASRPERIGRLRDALAAIAPTLTLYVRISPTPAKMQLWPPWALSIGPT